MKILAIETSCDETAASVIEKTPSGVKILSNIVASQIEIHQKYGGVFPEHASRAHVEKIIPVVEQALIQAEGISLSERRSRLRSVFGESRMSQNGSRRVGRLGSPNANGVSRGQNDIDIIAVTTGPGLIGSLLVGVNFAKTLSYAKNLPIIGINHWLGHIYSNWAEKPFPQFPALILIASGGHTGLVLMKSHKKIIPLGETLDDAAGEAFDKVAKLLDLGYPGGPAIAAAAAAKFKNQNAKNKKTAIQKLKIEFPRSMLDSGDFNFSFSGLKTAVLYKYKEVISRDSGVINSDLSSDNQSPNHNKSHGKAANHLTAAIAAEFQQAVIDILIGKTIQAAYEYQPKSICLCGGVSANKELREQMKKAVSGLPSHPSFHVPAIHLSTDNAAMIGIAAAYHLNEATTWKRVHANANLKLYN